MDIKLTWNLFIGGFFILILAYSVINGKNQTLKIIIASYLAALASDGLANLIYKYFLMYSPLAESISAPLLTKYFLFFKILLFIGLIVFLVIKAEYYVELDSSSPLFLRFLTTVIFAVLSAGLLISTVLVFVSGGTFIGATGGSVDATQIADLYKESRLVRIMVNNYNLWFSIPAIALILDSMISRRKNV